MLSRRNFLKTGLTTGAAALPLVAKIDAIDPATLAAQEARADESGTTGILIPLPDRLPPVNPASEPWQKRVRRVGQTNMTEHDPAVMNMEEWADYWHCDESRRGVCKRNRHSCFLSVKSSVPQARKIPERP